MQRTRSGLQRGNKHQRFFSIFKQTRKQNPPRHIAPMFKTASSHISHGKGVHRDRHHEAVRARCVEEPAAPEPSPERGRRRVRISAFTPSPLPNTPGGWHGKGSVPEHHAAPLLALEASPSACV